MQLECINTDPLNLSDCPFFPRIILEFQMGWLLNGSFPLGKAVLSDKKYYEKRRRFYTLFFLCVCIVKIVEEEEECRKGICNLLVITVFSLKYHFHHEFILCLKHYLLVITHNFNTVFKNVKITSLIFYTLFIISSNKYLLSVY